jgi:superfamily II DNA or RNA helicase
VPKFSPGDLVCRKTSTETRGVISSVDRVHAGIQYYSVFINNEVVKIPEFDLAAIRSEPTILQPLVDGPLGHFGEFQRLLTYFRLHRETPLLNHIYAFNASRTRFYPHQFKPLIKFLESPNYRILIADEVGLGKTIEAGLILTEMEARQSPDRVLVVCPANLVEKWRTEMRMRFGQKFTIYRAGEFRKYLQDFDKDNLSADLRGIISLESLRSANLMQDLEEIRPDFGLVIFDEAHHLRNFGRKQRKAGVLLSELTQAMVFLTATPIQMGEENLFSLLNILEPDEFRDRDNTLGLFNLNIPIIKAQNLISRIPPKADEARDCLARAGTLAPWIAEHPDFSLAIEAIENLMQPEVTEDSAQLIVKAQRHLSNVNLLGHVFTRSKKRDVMAARVERRAHSHKVKFGEHETSFYNAVTAFVRAESATRTEMPLIRRWMLNTPQRRMASSIPAMVKYYRRTMGTGAWEFSEDEGFWEDEFELATPEQELEIARKRLMSVLAKWPTNAVDSKYRDFRTIIQSAREQRGQAKILVFAFFKDTLYYLASRLKEDGIRAAVICGDVKAEDRARIVQNFRTDPQVEILLSSKVGSEGLDFQFCSTLVNYDLPWNPMDIEQRIGRLDRLGQEAQVIDIHNLSVEGTIEERILYRLFDRIEIFKRSIGDIEAILGDEWKELEKDLLSTSLTPEEENERIESSFRVFARRMEDLETLESNAARFLGTDLYFEQEVERIKDRFRFVSSKQLHDYVHEFLSRHCPHTRFSYDTGTSLGIIVPCHKLKHEITFAGEAPALRNFLAVGSSGIKFTFDSEKAFDSPQLEFINVTHSLINVITKKYQKDETDFSRAHHLALMTDEIPQGTYLYFVWRLRIKAAKDYNSLELIVLDENLNEIQPAGGPERLLGLILESGTDPHVRDLDLDPELVNRMFEHACGLFHRRASIIRCEKERTNDAYIDRRIRSIENHYGKTIASLESQIRQALSSEKSEAYVRMLKGKLNKAEGTLHSQVHEIEKNREISEESSELASGILESSPLRGKRS